MFSGETNSLDFQFYEPDYFNSDLTKRSGGAITSTRLSTDSIESLGAIKAARNSQTIVYHYRKIFFKNNTEYNLSGVKAFIEPDCNYLAIAKEKVYRDYSVSATGLPNGYGHADFYTPYDYTNGLSIGNISSGASTGLWLKIGLRDESIVEEESLSKDLQTKVYFEGYIE